MFESNQSLPVHVRVGTPKPEEDGWISIIENNGTRDFQIIIQPNTGLYVKIIQLPKDSP